MSGGPTIVFLYLGLDLFLNIVMYPAILRVFSCVTLTLF